MEITIKQQKNIGEVEKMKNRLTANEKQEFQSAERLLNDSSKRLSDAIQRNDMIGIELAHEMERLPKGITMEPTYLEMNKEILGILDKNKRMHAPNLWIK